METEVSNKVAITGFGAISPYGLGADAVYEAVCDGRSYADQIDCPRDDSKYQRCPDINLQRVLNFKNLGRYRNIAQYTIASIKETMEMAHQTGDPVDPSKVAISYGTSNGPASATQEIYDDLLAMGAGSVKPRVFQESVFNSPASLASIFFKFTGPISVTPNSLCAGPYALLQGQLFLANPNVDGVVVVCSEEVCRAVQKALVQLKFLKSDALADVHTNPFSSAHSGGVISEGSACVFLEPMDKAIKRGATILAELEGVGCANDSHQLAQNNATGIGLITAVQNAQQDSQTKAIPDVIFSGSSCTQKDDELEQNALRKIFQDECPKQFSSRGVLGISMGVSTVFDLLIAIISLNKKKLPTLSPRYCRYGKMASTIVDETNSQINETGRILINSIGVNGLFGAVQVRGVKC